MEDISKEEYIELFSTFKAELEIHANKLNKDLLYMEKNPDSDKRVEILQGIMGDAHNIKGAARIVELPEISDIAQSFETVVGAIYKGELPQTSEIFDVLYEAVDLMIKAVNERIKGTTLDVSHIVRQLSLGSEELRWSPRRKTREELSPLEEKETIEEKGDSIEHREEAVEEDGKEEESKEEVALELDQLPFSVDKEAHPAMDTITPDEKVLISAKKLDSLMDLVGELLVAKIKNEQRLTEIKNVFFSIEHSLTVHEEVQALLAKISRNDHDKDVLQLLKLYKSLLTDNNNVAGVVKTIVKDFTRDSRHLSLITDFLQDDIKRTRMLPMSTVFDSFERMVRDLSRKQGKKVRLDIYGRDVELDKKILEKIKDPIMHIIRNSIDHGIETPVQRKKKKKSELSQIILDFKQRGSNIFIRIKDDGTGLNLEKLCRAAVQKNLISNDAAKTMSPEEISSLIFLPGFSTSRKVTDISGRGVGMDVVKRNIENLHGLVEVSSEKNVGTEITIRIPLTLATLNVLLVSSNAELLAIPSLAIDKILRMKSADILRMEGKDVVLIDGDPVSIACLNDVLSLPGKSKIFPHDFSFYCLLISSTRKKMAFIIDDLLGEQELVIKRLGEQDSKIQGVSGATVLGTGKIVIILNPVELVDMAGIQGNITTLVSATDEEEKIQRILVIDDSISTRNFEKNVLASAGYEVVVATNGQEGLDLVEKMNFDLIVSDIHMPKVNGLEFTERIKTDPQFAEIPVILISALESKEDMAKGLEVGAEAYIIKSTFHRQNLLDTVERLI